MKCNCGFEEVDSKYVQVETLYISGKKKGQVKSSYRDYIRGTSMDMGSITMTFDNKTIRACDVKICPDCKLMYFDDYIPECY